jgi:Zn-dependent protease/predicted transcriptional regulator
MFGKSYYLFSILGFRIGLDLSWFLLAFLIVWSLATGYFPTMLPGLEQSLYVWMAIVGALGLFASLIFHELAHAIVARYYHLRISGITLFVFGGVAQLEEEPRTAKVEFLVAIAGPIASMILAVLFYGLLSSGVVEGVPAIDAVVGYLALINFMLAAFNLIPAFPLDGGRILRAALWWWQGSLPRATRTAAAVGAVLGIALMGFGAYNMYSGVLLAGTWQLLIGFFIYTAAGAARAQARRYDSEDDTPAEKVITRAPVTLPANLTLEDAAERFFFEYRFKSFPVVEGEQVVGLVTLDDMDKTERTAWPQTRVFDVMQPLSAAISAEAGEPALEVLKRMTRSGHTRMVVMDGTRLAGMLTKRDIMNFFSAAARAKQAAAVDMPPERTP